MPGLADCKRGRLSQAAGGDSLQSLGSVAYTPASPAGCGQVLWGVRGRSWYSGPGKATGVGVPTPATNPTNPQKLSCTSPVFAVLLELFNSSSYGSRCCIKP